MQRHGWLVFRVGTVVPELSWARGWAMGRPKSGFTGQCTDIDVLFQVGLDGIQMLDPATSRTLRIYPFDTVMRWEVLDSCIFAFWAKMPVDFEPKRIRLKSTSYTTTTILDTVTAANVQVPDEAVNKCTSCGTNFNAFQRKHHCRNCGEIFCDKCTQGRTPLTLDEEAQPVRVCDRCMAEVTQRLDNAREAANRTGSLLSHEDLAKKLKIWKLYGNVCPVINLQPPKSITLATPCIISREERSV